MRDNNDSADVGEATRTTSLNPDNVGVIYQKAAKIAQALLSAVVRSWSHHIS
jgi:hypothetical protein